MSEVFADTNFWVALTNPNDRWHSAARAAARELAPRRLVTTEDVLTEFLAFLAEQGPQFRQVATLTLRSILLDVEVVIQTHDAFLAALAFCESRPDQGYSLTDCVSMSFMYARGITDVLTNDERFRQEGFRTLL
jgi:uncharacterized protein